MSQTELTLDDFLRGLGSEGQRESGVSFTMDPAKALEKLREFQLSNPFHYSLKWLQAAVAGGAESFAWKSTTRKVSAEMRGLAFPLKQLPNILFHLLEDSHGKSDRAFRHLAIGVNSAVGTRASQLQLRSWNGDEGLEVTWKTTSLPEVTSWTPTPPMSIPLTQILMRRAQRDISREIWDVLRKYHVQDMMFGGKNARDPEQVALHGSAGLCPIKVTINGVKPERFVVQFQRRQKTVQEGFRDLFDWKKKVDFPAEKYLDRSPDSPGFTALSERMGQHSEGYRINQKFGLFLAAARPGLLGYTHTYMVVDGVIVREFALLKGQAEGVVVYDAGGLSTDLTTFNFLQDENWRLFEEYLFDSLRQLAGTI